SSLHKKQAVEPKRPVWLAPFVQRVHEPRVTEDISEPEKPSTLQQKKDSEDVPIFGASAASGRMGLAAENVKPVRGTEADTLQTTDHILLRGDKHAVFDVAAFPDAVRRQLGSIDPESRD
ncbi:hypothetical protein GGH16_002494, partial [Coemansia sp. RSA 560]